MRSGQRYILGQIKEGCGEGVPLCCFMAHIIPLEGPVDNRWLSTGGKGGVTCTPSKLPMGAETENRHRPAVAVIGRVAHKLIVERQLGKFKYCHAVVGLQDGLNAGVDKLPVPHEDTKTTSSKELLCVP